MVILDLKTKLTFNTDKSWNFNPQLLKVNLSLTW